MDLLVNDFCGLDEVFEDKQIPFVVSLSDQEAINEAVLRQLAFKKLINNKTSSLSCGLDLVSTLCKWQSLLGLK